MRPAYVLRLLPLSMTLALFAGGATSGSPPSTNNASRDVTVPMVSSTAPADRSTGVALGTTITVIFGELMDAPTVTTVTPTVKAGPTTAAGT